MMRARTLQDVNERMETVIDLVDAAAKRYPLKKLAHDLRPGHTKAKAESTLRGELNQSPGSKLGVTTCAQILFKTGDLSPLHELNAMFGLTAFQLPDCRAEELSPLMAHTANLSREFSETIREVAMALEDDRLELDEAERCIKEVRDLIEAAVQFKGTLMHMIENLRREQ